MKSRRIFTTVFIILLLLQSCSSNNENNSRFEFFPLEQTSEIDDISPFVKDVQIEATIEDTDISAILKLVVTNDKIFYLSDIGVFSLLPNSLIPLHYGDVGRGRGEYIGIIDFFVDNDVLFCLDPFGRILKYATYDGEYLGCIDPRSNTPINPHSIFPTNNGGYALYYPNPETFEGPFKCIWSFDYDGRIVDNSLCWDDFNIVSSFVPLTSTPSNNQYYVSYSSEKTSCICYSDGEVKCSYYFNFENNNLPYRYAFRGVSNPWEKIEDIFEKDYYKLFGNIFPMINGSIFFSASGKESSIWNFLFPTESKNGIRWQSIGSIDPPIMPIGSDGNYLYYYIDGIDPNTTDPLQKYLIKNVSKTIEKSIIKISFNV